MYSITLDVDGKLLKSPIYNEKHTTCHINSEFWVLISVGLLLNVYFLGRTALELYYSFKI